MDLFTVDAWTLRNDLLTKRDKKNYHPHIGGSPQFPILNTDYSETPIPFSLVGSAKDLRVGTAAKLVLFVSTGLISYNMISSL